ncbi:hypothetical protein K6119_18200 [Paracrocinitomix mangrovi]|uniref:hypothetical protein n=1 Tax=Paracrocinitomix mangrovi TaxID=2862509 RepID=UPI001C8EA71D|nr:hypothetical protein [Paracrocinitomix mangrovi]UKN01658.1 hypothetical protein K6119_18200 [Paracrocinitomix mangrovi]
MNLKTFILSTIMLTLFVSCNNDKLEEDEENVDSLNIEQTEPSHSALFGVWKTSRRFPLIYITEESYETRVENEIGSLFICLDSNMWEIFNFSLAFDDSTNYKWYSTFYVNENISYELLDSGNIFVSKNALVFDKLILDTLNVHIDTTLDNPGLELYTFGN